MDNPQAALWMDLWIAVKALSIAIVGGLVSWFQKWANPAIAPAWTWGEFAFKMLMSAFVGYLAWILCDDFNFGKLSPFVIGMSGHMGAEAIGIFKDVFRGLLDRAAKSPEKPDAKG